LGAPCSGIATKPLATYFAIRFTEMMTWLLLIIQQHLYVSFYFIQVLSITDLIISRRLAINALRRCDQQQQQQPPSRHVDLSYIKVMILLDLLWICLTTYCTTNPEQTHNKSTTDR